MCCCRLLAAEAPWSPRHNSSSQDLTRNRDTADILLLRLGTSLFELAHKRAQEASSTDHQRQGNMLTGKEIEDRLLEWLACDRDTAFLLASVLLQQSLLFHVSLGVFINTSTVFYSVKNPVLVHYTRCMKLGLGKECSQGKKKKCNSLALVSSVLGENNVRTQARAVSQAQTLSIGYSSTFHTWSRSCVSNPLATLSLSVKRL